MKVAILRERLASESRVAASPETVKKLKGLGLNVFVEEGAGKAASIPDVLYKDAGAHIVSSRQDLLKDVHIILKVRSPLQEEEKLEDFPENALLICMCDILNRPKDIKAYAKQGLSVVAVEMIPRITRAQPMDVLSSQSNLAGYRAAIEAAYLYKCIFPMMMTAAGTLLPAKVLVVGAGVAGLQAIATVKRLGAVVYGYDVRPTTKEQVESLGASFIEVQVRGTAETQGGYAKEMTAEYKERESEKLADVIRQMDIVITTALIPGRPAPRLITETMVDSMKPGSVIVDLAGESGGNCALSLLGKVVERDGVTIYAPENIIGKVSTDATRLYAQNIFNFIRTFYDADGKKMNLSLEDEIIRGSLLTQDGKVLRNDLIE